MLPQAGLQVTSIGQRGAGGERFLSKLPGDVVGYGIVGEGGDELKFLAGGDSGGGRVDGDGDAGIESDNAGRGTLGVLLQRWR